MSDNQEWKNSIYKVTYNTNGTPTKEECITVINLMIKKTNKKLYKYRSGNERDLDNLKNNKLPLCNGNSQNDPYEFFFIPKEYKEKFKDSISDEEWEEINKINKEFRSKYYLCSFTDKNNDILMWSHYSNNHKGFCIEYKIEALYNSCGPLIPIFYSDVPISINLKKSADIRPLYTKYRNWNYENEWRIIKSKDEGYKSLFEIIDTPKPSGIYMGCEIESELKDSLLRYCIENNISLYQGYKSRQEYKIKFKNVPINV